MLRLTGETHKFSKKKKNVAEDRRLALTSSSRAGADRLSDQINTPCPHHKHAKSYAHKNTHTYTRKKKKKSACTPLRASTIHPPLSSLPPHPAISAGQIKLKYSLENNRRQSVPIGAPRKKLRVSPAAHRTWNTIHKSQTSRTVFETGHVVCAARKEKKKKSSANLPSSVATGREEAQEEEDWEKKVVGRDEKVV